MKANNNRSGRYSLVGFSGWVEEVAEEAASTWSAKFGL